MLLKIRYRRDKNNNMKTVMNKPHNPTTRSKNKKSNHTSTQKRKQSIVILA